MSVVRARMNRQLRPLRRVVVSNTTNNTASTAAVRHTPSHPRVGLSRLSGLRAPSALLYNARSRPPPSPFPTTLTSPQTPPSPHAIRTFTSTATTLAMSGFYNLKPELPNGTPYDFEQLKGKVVLVVNVASKWCVLIRRGVYTVGSQSCL